MSSTKQALVRYIETFASARASGNPDLQAFAANQLSSFIDSLPLDQPETAEPELTSSRPEGRDSQSDQPLLATS